MKLHRIDPQARYVPFRIGKGVANTLQAFIVQRGGRVVLSGEAQRRKRKCLPAILGRRWDLHAATPRQTVEALRPVWPSWTAIGIDGCRRTLSRIRAIAASVASS
jgi:hypothetical protein